MSVPFVDIYIKYILAIKLAKPATAPHCDGNIFLFFFFNSLRSKHGSLYPGELLTERVIMKT